MAQLPPPRPCVSCSGLVAAYVPVCPSCGVASTPGPIGVRSAAVAARAVGLGFLGHGPSVTSGAPGFAATEAWSPRVLVRATEAVHSMTSGPVRKRRPLRERVGMKTSGTSDIGPIGPLGSNLRGGTVTWFHVAQTGFTVTDVPSRWGWVRPAAVVLLTLVLLFTLVWFAI